MKQRFFFIVFGFLVIGCSSIPSSINTLRLGISRKELMSIVKQAPSVEKVFGNNLVYLKYEERGLFALGYRIKGLYLQDDKLIKVSTMLTPFEEIDDWLNLGIISKEEHERLDSQIARRESVKAQRQRNFNEFSKSINVDETMSLNKSYSITDQFGNPIGSIREQ